MLGSGAHGKCPGVSAEPERMQRCCLSRLALACESANWEQQKR